MILFLVKIVVFKISYLSGDTNFCNILNSDSYLDENGFSRLSSLR